jgi:hypothetical protein
MSHLDHLRAVRSDAVRPLPGFLAGLLEVDGSGSLADTLSAIQEKRGACYMLEMSRYVIEKWDLGSDQLDAQSGETLELVAKLLK